MSLAGKLDFVKDNFFSFFKTLLNFSIKFPSIAGVIWFDSEDKFKEYNADRPYVSLHKTIITLSPYFLRNMTSGAIVVGVPNNVPTTLSVSLVIYSFLEKPKSIILY